MVRKWIFIHPIPTFKCYVLMGYKVMFFEFFLGIKWTIGITYSLNVVFQLWWKTIGWINIHLRTIQILFFIFYFFCYNFFSCALWSTKMLVYVIFWVCVFSLNFCLCYLLHSNEFMRVVIIFLATEFLGFWYIAVMLGIVLSCVGFFNNNKYLIH